jgi:hypothetical protein
MLAAVNNPTSTRLSADGTTGMPHVGKPDACRVRLWDLLAGEELSPLPGHPGAITALAFAPGGDLLATASNDTIVLLWDTARLRSRDRARTPLEPGQLERLWSDLNGADAARAYRAVIALANSPDQGVELLRRHLKPAAPVDTRRVAQLLAQLDSEQFAAREQAMRELEKLGDQAVPPLQAALDGNPPLELKRRLERLLERANGRERLGMLRALEALEMMNTKEARQLCAALAGGLPDAPQTRAARAALERMKRRPIAMP